MKYNIDKALEKAITNLAKLDEAAAEINSKQKAVKDEVDRLTRIKYGKSYYDLIDRLKIKGIKYNDVEVRAAFDTNNFLLLHELSLKAKGGSPNADNTLITSCHTDI